MKTILVTGGAGFIGSNFIPLFLEKNPEAFVVNLDKLTYAGTLENLREVESHPRYQFVQGDICDRPLVEGLFNRHNFSGVIHFAAESHVDNSIAGPEAFISTNVVGTFVVLDVARRHWLTGPGRPKPGCENNRFHHISTDEVYGSLGPTGKFSESTPYAPNSPYSASKAAADMLVRSYFHTYGLNVVTTNCSNNYGPKQHREKLIPTIIRKALDGQPIPIYGDGRNVRDWLFVDDHCKAVETVYHRGRAGETYNVGGENELTNNSIAAAICTLLDKIRPRPDGKSYQTQLTFVEDRAGHDKRYAIDARKIMAELGWSPEQSFVAGIRTTVEWYISRHR